MNEPLNHRLSRYPSRKSVADAALAAAQPFSAKQLTLYLRGRGHRASKATIYRTLGLLVRNGLLKESTLPRGDLLYFPPEAEGSVTWICTACGAARRTPLSTMEGLLRREAGRQGFRPAGLDVQVYARCENRCEAGLARIWQAGEPALAAV